MISDFLQRVKNSLNDYPVEYSTDHDELSEMISALEEAKTIMEKCITKEIDLFVFEQWIKKYFGEKK